MDQWLNKVAVVTGASSGIGEGIAKLLTQKGLKVVGLARRIERLKHLQDNWKNYQGCFYPIQCDLRNEDEILKAFEWVKNSLGGVDILVNNAGLSLPGKIIDGSSEFYRHTFDINTIAIAICAREAVRSMKERKVPGYIVNICSILAFYPTLAEADISVYAPSKCAVKSMSEIMQKEIKGENLDIKVTNLSPGLVKTEIADNLGLSNVFENRAFVEAEDIANGVLYVLSTPPHVLISELTIRPFKNQSNR